MPLLKDQHRYSKTKDMSSRYRCPLQQVRGPMKETTVNLYLNSWSSDVRSGEEKFRCLARPRDFLQCAPRIIE